MPSTATTLATELDILVVGAGVVGLACATMLRVHGHTVAVVERERRAGTVTSARNSGVVHAGIHGPVGSLKTRLCIEGARRLYAWCERYGVPHARTGKWVLAVEPGEAPELEALDAHAHELGATGPIERVSAAELARREPSLRAAEALYFGPSGLVDAHAFVESLRAEAERTGVIVALGAEATALRHDGHAWHVDIRRTPFAARATEPPERVTAGVIVNAAGLEAPTVAAESGIDLERHGWVPRLVKGSYFTVSPRVPLPNVPLVYPLPSGDGGLGIHLTRTLGGEWLAGPDVEPVETHDFDVHATRGARFATSVARYAPAIRPEHLSPAYAGIRPKLGTTGFHDFVLTRGDAHGAPDSVHLLGIESPGLTASLAIAEEVVRLLT
ncbi:MAG: NAD(P)/FAD-dependent oxidoreductase [Myxococcales bacterium]|nr:NAD(P)/FAD-dependent oxidoreductase [Myxococcales bacterium]